MPKRRISNAIRRLRFDAGEMTQKELAEKVGVTRQTIVAIEAARYSPTLELAFAIAEAFDRPLSDVFFWEPPPDDAPPGA
jgi:putative transcriptional regulator